MPSKVLAAMGLLALTLAGGAILYYYVSPALKVLRGHGEPSLRYIASYNETHGIYYVISGCIEGPIPVYNATLEAFSVNGRACAGDLVLLRPERAVAVARVEGQ